MILVRFFLLISLLISASLASVSAYADNKLDYLLGAGDSIRVLVFQNPELTTDTRVAESGTISFPLVGEINVGGKTIREAEQLIAQSLISGGFVQQPQVNIVLVQVLGNRVAVLGLVNRPGRYPLETFNTHISEIIATAGGVAPNGGNGYVFITGERNGQPYKYEVDIASLFLNDKKELDVLVRNGDVLYVVPGNSISVLGQVNRPGRIPLESFQMKLTDALALAAGISVSGSDSVVLTGVRDGQPFKKEVNLADHYLANAQNPDEIVQAGDQIYVHRAPVYYIYGEAQRPGSYRVERNMTVIQALAQGGGPTVRGTQRSIKLYRRNQNGEVVQSTPALTDAIKPDDVLYVRESLF